MSVWRPVVYNTHIRNGLGPCCFYACLYTDKHIYMYIYIYIYTYIYESANWVLNSREVLNPSNRTPSFLQNTRKFDLRLWHPETVTSIYEYKKSRRRCPTYGRDVVSYCYLRFCNHSRPPWLTSSSVIFAPWLVWSRHFKGSWVCLCLDSQ